MTRINLTKPQSLTDQHLFTEYRELPRIFNNVRAAISAGKTWQKDYAKKAPKEFVLGTGHMIFFYNKLDYLAKRHLEIVKECLARNISISHKDGIDYSDIPSSWLGDYTPTPEAIAISQERLDEKIAMKPNWYLYWSSNLSDWELQPCYNLMDNYGVEDEY